MGMCDRTCGCVPRARIQSCTQLTRQFTMSWFKGVLKSVKEAVFGAGDTGEAGGPSSSAPSAANVDAGNTATRGTAKRKAREARHNVSGPVLDDATVPGGGGVQGLTWYLDKQRVDQDMDTADAFYEEKPSGGLVEQQGAPLSKRERLCISRLANGNVDLDLRHLGRAKRSPG